MMSEIEVVDPSLDLQQLASEAINYQLQLQQDHRQRKSELSTGVPDDADAKFICIFPACNRLYKRKDLLKRHLTTLLASPDEHHQDQTIWAQVRESGVMTVYSRPRNLTEEQKKQRRK